MRQVPINRDMLFNLLEDPSIEKSFSYWLLQVKELFPEKVQAAANASDYYRDQHTIDLKEATVVKRIKNNPKLQDYFLLLSQHPDLLEIALSELEHVFHPLSKLKGA